MMGSRSAWDMKEMRINNRELRERLKAVEEAGLAHHPSDRYRVNAMLMAIGLDHTAIPPAMSEDTEFPGGVRYHPHTLRRLERERDEARAERDALKGLVLKVDRLFREANLPEHERLAPRDLERLKREVWRTVREALTT